MAICLVSGTLLDASGSAIQSLEVSARVIHPVFSGSSLITPATVTCETDSSGNFSITMQQSISVVFTVSYPPIGTEPMRLVTYTGNIPATATASFSNVVVSEI